MDKKYKGSSCELVDAFVILTRQGVVLASDDARLAPDEDSYLYQLNQKLIDRVKQPDEDAAFRSWLRAQSELIVTAVQEGYTQEEAVEMVRVYQMTKGRGKNKNV